MIWQIKFADKLANYTGLEDVDATSYFLVFLKDYILCFTNIQSFYPIIYVMNPVYAKIITMSSAYDIIEQPISKLSK